MTVSRRGDAHKRERGQAVVEFSLVIVVFLVVVMAILDFGRAIYMYNGVSEAAREIARASSVHPGSSFSNSALWSPETKAAVATQKIIIPGLADPTLTCVDIAGNPAPSGPCLSSDGYSVKVTVDASYAPVTPLLGLTGTWTLTSSSSIAMQ